MAKRAVWISPSRVELERAGLTRLRLWHQVIDFDCIDATQDMYITASLLYT